MSLLINAVFLEKVQDTSRYKKIVALCSIKKRFDFTQQVSFIMLLSTLRQAKIGFCVPTLIGKPILSKKIV